MCIKKEMARWRGVTIPKRNTIHRAAMMDMPAPDRDASVKSLGIFLHCKQTPQFEHPTPDSPPTHTHIGTHSPC